MYISYSIKTPPIREKNVVYSFTFSALQLYTVMEILKIIQSLILRLFSYTERQNQTINRESID